MKKLLYGLLATVVLFTSCQKEDTQIADTNSGDQVTINVTANDVVATRAASTSPTRYIVAVFSDQNCTTPINLFGAEDAKTHQKSFAATNGSATININIDRTINYYFLFWSDISGEDVFNTDDLRAVELQTGKNPVEAWAGAQAIEVGEITKTIDVELSRSVAKINLMETGKLIAGSSLQMKIHQPSVFNVRDLSTNNTTAERIEVFSVPTAVDGSSSAVKLNNSEIYVFAPKNSSKVIDIEFKMSASGIEEEAFVVTNIPLQGNRATNINGHYTQLASAAFNVSLDKNWVATENQRPIRYQIGDVYILNNEPVGVVFQINEDGTSGKVVYKTNSYLSNGEGWGWGYQSTNAKNRTNGLINTINITSRSNWESTFRHFAWIHSLNVAANSNFDVSSYTEDAKNIWYYPAIDELKMLYNGEVFPDNVNHSDRKVLEIVNNTLSSEFGEDSKILGSVSSSTEEDMVNVWILDINESTTKTSNKGGGINVVPILAF